MAHQLQDETKQPPPPPSTETNTALATTSNMYLSTHLIVPYFITAGGEIKRPEHLIAWWSRIFSFLYVPDDKDHIELRFLCRLFRDSLKPPPLWTTFPHPNYPTLNELMDNFSAVFEKDPSKAPKIVYVMEGTFTNASDVRLNYPMRMIGAGQRKTFLSGCGLTIQGTKEEGKRVVLKDLTMKGSSNDGILALQGLSFLCDRMTFTQCGSSGVVAYKTKGRLINCVITQCENSGIYCCENAFVELEGSQTKVDGNNTSEDSDEYGLMAYATSSIIHLLFPLTKESVSTNNHNGKNYGGFGTILEVVAFGK
jgi:hypothetical protein